MASSIAIYAVIITVIVIGFVMVYIGVDCVGVDTDLEFLRCVGTVAVLLGLVFLSHYICEEFKEKLETEQREEIEELKEEAQQDIKDGYTVYVDCKKVDSEAVDFDWSTTLSLLSSSAFLRLAIARLRFIIIETFLQKYPQ